MTSSRQLLRCPAIGPPAPLPSLTRAVAAIAVAGLACCTLATKAPEGSPEAPDPTFRVFSFRDGAIFDDALSHRRVRLLIGAAAGVGEYAATLSSSGQSTDRGFDVVGEGRFDLRACRLRLEHSPGDSPVKLPATIDLARCDWDPVRQTLTILSSEPDQATASGLSRRAFNFVVILTDDQRFDTLAAMSRTMDLAESGIVFDRAYTTIPMCCPFRASFLAGGVHAHNTNVSTNEWPNGGAERFDDSQSLATELYGIGYRTGLFGKYMNGLANIAPRLPQGWTEFAANLPSGRFPETSWSDFYVLEGSRWPGRRHLRTSSESEESGFFSHVEQYSLDYYSGRVLSFLDHLDGRPFLLYVAPRAPHTPATPAAADQSLFPDFEYRGRAYGEIDLGDKPEWVQAEASRFGQWRRERGDLPRRSLQSLQAVDRLVGSVFRKLDELDILDATIVFFTSDSGMQWLEHRLTNKGVPYEESLRVPFVAWVPESRARRDEHLVAANLDIPATILAYSGLDARTDGRALQEHFQAEQHSGRETLFFEQYPLYYEPSVRGRNLDRSFLDHYFSGLRISRAGRELKYVEHYSGEIELYDLVEDPFEEESRHDASGMQDLIATLSRELAVTKGLGITTRRLPTAVSGRPYSYVLQASGGKPPYSWRVVDTARVPGIRTRRHVGPPIGSLPQGLRLDGDSGTIQGTPRRSGVYEFVIEVVDTSADHRTNGVQTYYAHLDIRVEPAPN